MTKTEKIQVIQVKQDGYYASIPKGFKTVIVTTEVIPTEKFKLIKDAIEKILNNE